jgi:hypothetical protein
LHDVHSFNFDFALIFYVLPEHRRVKVEAEAENMVAERGVDSDDRGAVVTPHHESCSSNQSLSPHE